MASKNERPIIIVRKKKRGIHVHHGGAWKVAYADFVTAMMLVGALLPLPDDDDRAFVPGCHAVRPKP